MPPMVAWRWRRTLVSSARRTASSEANPRSLMRARMRSRRRVTGTSPIKVEYNLTDRGRELEPALAEIQEWANRWMASG